MHHLSKVSSTCREANLTGLFQLQKYREVDIRLAGHIAEVALQDLPAAFYVRVGHHHVAVESSWPHQSFVQRLWEVGGSHDNDSITGLEAANKSSAEYHAV